LAVELASAVAAEFSEAEQGICPRHFGLGTVGVVRLFADKAIEDE
jgi:hypothetical protein